MVGPGRDPSARKIGTAWWLQALFFLSAPGFAALLIFATLEILDNHRGGPLTILMLAVMWLVLFGLVVLPSTWYVIRTLRGKPALQVDARGLVWGDDWSKDLAIEWKDIAGIGSRKVQSRGYSDNYLLIHPRDLAIPSHLSPLVRLAARVTRAIYGTPFTIGPGTLRMKRWELLALLRQHYQGPIDPAPFA